MSQPLLSRRTAVLASALTALLACTGDVARDPAAPKRVVASEATSAVESSAGVRSANTPPRMIVKTRPALDTSTSPPTLRGDAPFTVLWNLCTSDDPDTGDSLNWQFNFGDSGRPAFNADGTFNPDFDQFCRIEHTYREGSYTATLSVTDKHLEDQSRETRAAARTSQQVRVLALGPPPPAPPPPTTLTTTVTVSIQSFAFTPTIVTVKLGQTVTWVNADSTQHTVTSDSGAFGSAALSNGASFSQTFNALGSFPYHCSFHTFMTGTVNVIP